MFPNLKHNWKHVFRFWKTCFQDVFKCVQCFQIFSHLKTCFQNPKLSKYENTFSDFENMFSKCFQMFSIVFKFFQMFSNILKFESMISNFKANFVLAAECTASSVSKCCCADAANAIVELPNNEKVGASSSDESLPLMADAISTPEQKWLRWKPKFAQDPWQR